MNPIELVRLGPRSPVPDRQFACAVVQFYLVPSSTGDWKAYGARSASASDIRAEKYPVILTHVMRLVLAAFGLGFVPFYGDSVAAQSGGCEI